MQLTKFLSQSLVEYWRAAPILLMTLIWLFFSGTKTIRQGKGGKLLPEVLLCLFVFGLAYSLVNFGVYGLVDPANGLAKPNAVPVTKEALARFELLGYVSFAVAMFAGIALEFRLRRNRG